MKGRWIDRKGRGGGEAKIERRERWEEEDWERNLGDLEGGAGSWWGYDAD